MSISKQDEKFAWQDLLGVAKDLRAEAQAADRWLTMIADAASASQVELEEKENLNLEKNIENIVQGGESNTRKRKAPAHAFVRNEQGMRIPRNLSGLLVVVRAKRRNICFASEF